MIERLTLLWKRFTPLEEHLLSEIRTVLPPAAHATFDAQLAAINRVQRLPPSWSGDLALYRMRRGKVDWSGVPSFALYRVKFAWPRSGSLSAASTIRAALLSVAGRVFELSDKPSSETCGVCRVGGGAEGHALGGPDAPVEQARHRTSARGVGRVLGQWSTCIRLDLAGSSCPAYRVTLEDGEYLVLAEREGEEFVLQRVEPPAEHLFLHELHEGAPRPIHGDVGEVLDEGA